MSEAHPPDPQPQPQPEHSSSSANAGTSSGDAAPAAKPAPKTSSKKAKAAAAKDDEDALSPDILFPIYTVNRIAKRVIPSHAKMTKEATMHMQRCANDFVSFISSEAGVHCLANKRKTVQGDDIIHVLSSMGYDNYAHVLQLFLNKYRNSTATADTGKKSSKRSRAQAEVQTGTSTSKPNNSSSAGASQSQVGEKIKTEPSPTDATASSSFSNPYPCPHPNSTFYSNKVPRTLEVGAEAAPAMSFTPGGGGGVGGSAGGGGLSSRHSVTGAHKQSRATHLGSNELKVNEIVPVANCVASNVPVDMMVTQGGVDVGIGGIGAIGVGHSLPPGSSSVQPVQVEAHMPVPVLQPNTGRGGEGEGVAAGGGGLSAGASIAER